MSDLKTLAPVTKGLFTWPSDDPRFIATKCKTCGSVMFGRVRAFSGWIMIVNSSYFTGQPLSKSYMRAIIYDHHRPLF